MEERSREDDDEDECSKLIATSFPRFAKQRRPHQTMLHLHLHHGSRLDGSSLALTSSLPRVTGVEKNTPTKRKRLFCLITERSRNSGNAITLARTAFEKEPPKKSFRKRKRRGKRGKIHDDFFTALFYILTLTAGSDVSPPIHPFIYPSVLSHRSSFRFRFRFRFSLSSFLLSR